MLRKREIFGRFGHIQKVAVILKTQRGTSSPNASAYITYRRKQVQHLSSVCVKWRLTRLVCMLRVCVLYVCARICVHAYESRVCAVH